MAIGIQLGRVVEEFSHVNSEANLSGVPALLEHTIIVSAVSCEGLK